jgi:tRNA(fMet)-specific endonuclease VapC
VIRYLLDTDICSYLAKRKFPQLQNRLSRIAPEAWAISAITYGEMLFGLEVFPAFHPLRFRTTAFLALAQILDWPSRAAVPYALIRNRTRDQPIGDRDLMIAAHAIDLDATLVTNNTRHYRRIGSPLRFENWIEER